MSASSLGGRDASGSRRHADLVPREYLRAIAVWSLIPAYMAAGALFGYLIDQWLGTFPFGLGVCLVLALALAVRDMIRLRDELAPPAGD
jgi:F0F1-type ATP synthase assembly protein I